MNAFFTSLFLTYLLASMITSPATLAKYIYLITIPNAILIIYSLKKNHLLWIKLGFVNS